jgi:hypothetical protein
VIEVIVIDNPAIERPSIEEIADGRGIPFALINNLLNFHPQRLPDPFLKIHYGPESRHEGIAILATPAGMHDILDIGLESDGWG